MDAKDYQHLAKVFLGAAILLLGSWLFAGEDILSELGEEMVAPDGTIDRVIDGDTVDVVVDGEVVRVRLIGIDTPEVVDPRKEVECFGAEASQHLKDLLTDEMIVLEYDASQGRVDRYGRELAYIILSDGRNLAEEMLRDGFAYEYTYDTPYKHQELFKNAEQDARDSERGLWSSETCGGNR